MLFERRYLSPRPPPKISLKHDHDWTRGNDQGSTVEHQPVGKLVQQSLGETVHFGSSKPTQFPKPIEDRTGQPVTQEIVGKSFNSLVEKFNMKRSPNQRNRNPNQSVFDRGNLIARKMLLLKVKRPVPTRSMQIDRGNLINCLKTSVSSVLTMEQGNLLSKAAQVHTHSERTICVRRKSWHCVIQHGQRVQPCNQRGEHWLQHSRITTFWSETITWRQRSKFYSEDRETPSATCTSQWSSTTSTIQPFQQRITRRDQSSWKHWTVWTTRRWTWGAVQSMPGILGCWHRILHVRALLTRWYDRKQEVHQVRSWSLFDSQL